MENILTTAFGSDASKVKLGKKTLGCFILKNGQHLITKESIPKAFGYDGKSDNWLFEFMMNINRLTPIEPALLESLGRPIKFQVSQSDILRQGISTDVFLETCNAILDAKNDGFLYVSELKFAKAAEEMLNHLTDGNLDAIIDYSSGYTLYKQNHKDALARKMAQATLSNYPAWIKSFSDEFFEMIFKFRNWDWPDLNRNAEKVGEYFNDLIFSRIDGALLETLETSQPKKKYRKNNTPEHYAEHPELKEYNSAITALMKTSAMNQAIFDKLINKSFPRRRQLSIETSAAKPSTSGKHSIFNESLLKAMRKK